MLQGTGAKRTEMAIVLDNKALVTIYGGTGFIGRHLVGAIAKTGARMRVAVSRHVMAGHLQPLGGVGQINAVQANVRYPDSLLPAARRADAVVNLVGILFPTGKQTFEAVQDEGAAHVAEAARAEGARAMVQVSAIGDNERSPSAYARGRDESEADVEKIVHDA